MPPELPVSSDNPPSFSNALPSAAALRDRDERLQALKELVGHVAHDLNNCLAPMVGYVTLLREDLAPETSGEQYLGKLDGSVRKAESLLQAIIQATHPERQYGPKLVDLTLLLQGTVETWMKSLPASVQISVESALAPCALWLDEALFAKLILQLLQNAQFAINRHGEVKLALACRTLTEAEATQLGLNDPSVFELSVQDSGSGMSEEVLKRACDPLFTTRPSSPSSGLGLTFVHSVVQLHGGQMAIESIDESGTCVRIWLPGSGSSM
jgi:signal transduction histidine kinase